MRNHRGKRRRNKSAGSRSLVFLFQIILLGCSLTASVSALLSSLTKGDEAANMTPQVVDDHRHQHHLQQQQRHSTPPRLRQSRGRQRRERQQHHQPSLNEFEKDGHATEDQEQPLQQQQNSDHRRQQDAAMMDMPFFDHGSSSGLSPRIVNGRDVETPNRYPYYVALGDNFGNHVCGGTLIARDAVLTAAHCLGTIKTAVVGLFDMNDPNPDAVEIMGIKDQYPHPIFVRELLSYDQMVIILDGPTKWGTPTVRINLDPTLLAYNTPNEPVAFRQDPNMPLPSFTLGIVGFGQISTDTGSGTNFVDPNPSRLQETTVAYVNNAQCMLAQQDELDYMDHITNDMICAMGQGTGQCYGDSGGPYLLHRGGDNPSSDLQVGIVSFGVGCANPSFPSVASRTSATNWIPTIICRFSQFPPDYFACSEGQSFSVAPTQGPTPVPTMRPTPLPTQPPQPIPPQRTPVSPVPFPASSAAETRPPTIDNMATVVLTIFLDDHPEETNWSIWNPGQTTMFRFGPYAQFGPDQAGTTTQTLIRLPAGDFYTFIMKDTGNNGIGMKTENDPNDIANVIPINPEVRFRLQLLKDDTNDPLASSDTVLLLEGNGHFAYEAAYFFFVPRVYADSSTDQLVMPTTNSASVFLTIHFDSWQPETSWRIVDAANHNITYAEVKRGAYQNGTDVTETVDLPLGRTYTLIMEDAFGDGILETEGYKLWMWADDQNSDANDSTFAGTPRSDVLEQRKEVVLVDGEGGFGFVSQQNFTLPGAS